MNGGNTVPSSKTVQQSLLSIIQATLRDIFWDQIISYVCDLLVDLV